MLLLQAPVEGLAGIWWFNFREKHPVAGCSGLCAWIPWVSIAVVGLYLLRACGGKTHELVQSLMASTKTKAGPFPTALPSNVVWNCNALTTKCWSVV